MKIVVQDDPLEEITTAARGRAMYDKLVIDSIQKARNLGVSWTRIGQALGVSHQAARQRYKHRIRDPGPVPSQLSRHWKEADVQ